MGNFEGIEIVQKDTILNREHAIGVTKMPGRKQIALYLREDGVLRTVAFFKDPNDADEVKQWLSLLCDTYNLPELDPVKVEEFHDV